MHESLYLSADLSWSYEAHIIAVKTFDKVYYSVNIHVYTVTHIVEHTGYLQRAKLRSVLIQYFAQNSIYMSLNAINATAPSSHLHLCP